ncbi:hypothetical protein ACFV0D_37710, partial [Streptomyces sp. NPDC059556]
DLTGSAAGAKPAVSGPGLDDDLPYGGYDGYDPYGDSAFEPYDYLPAAWEPGAPPAPPPPPRSAG